MPDENSRILLTGATGYVGGRLLHALEARRYRIRCVARRPEFLRPRVGPDTEVVAGDVFDAGSLRHALTGVSIAYYLVHSMGTSGTFEEKDLQGASNFGRAARDAGVRLIVYLGGLGDGDENLSPHLRSRHDVGRILRESGVPTIEFRASIIIGSGSLSFEMVRALAERLPIMITPKWVSVAAQPISIAEVIEYLVAALDRPVEESSVFEIGGADVVSYAEILREYAHQRGLRIRMIPVPVLTPRLSGLWLGLVTPLYARVGRKLIDSIQHPTVVRDERAERVFGIKALSMREAIANALLSEDSEFGATRWSDALSAAGGLPDWGSIRFGNRLVDSRTQSVPVSMHQAFEPIRRIGGATGWYYADWLWKLRGFMDLVAGGVGLRRGRRDPDTIRVGDTIDWWRVEAYERDRKLRLIAEMKLPGRAWLDFEIEPAGDGSIIRQTAIFDPVGLRGLAYWYAIYPLHAIVFRGMLRAIADASLAVAERESRQMLR